MTTKHIRSRVARCLNVLAVLLTIGVGVMIGGCSQEHVDQGPPPDGYATWDDYWAARDRLNRTLEQDQQRRLDNPGNDPTRAYSGRRF